MEDVKITIAGVDADNALDLLMKSLEKNLKGLTLDEFKEEVNEAISNKKQKAGKKSRVRKGKKGRRTKRGRGPSEKRKSEVLSTINQFPTTVEEEVIANQIPYVFKHTSSGNSPYKGVQDKLHGAAKLQ